MYAGPGSLQTCGSDHTILADRMNNFMLIAHPKLLRMLAAVNVAYERELSMLATRIWNSTPASLEDIKTACKNYCAQSKEQICTRLPRELSSILTRSLCKMLMQAAIDGEIFQISDSTSVWNEDETTGMIGHPRRRSSAVRSDRLLPQGIVTDYDQAREPIAAAKVASSQLCIRVLRHVRHRLQATLIHVSDRYLPC